MPDEDRQRRAETTSRRRRQLVFVGGVVTVALLAATLSSVITVLILVSNGMLLASRNAAPDPKSGGGGEQPCPDLLGLTFQQRRLDGHPRRRCGRPGRSDHRRRQRVRPIRCQRQWHRLGLIYDASGWILTNRHVVGSEDSVKVELHDGRKFTGHVYGIDTLTDLAIVKIDATGLPVAPIGDSSKLKPGQLAVAIGSPLGTFTNSVTSGRHLGARPRRCR